MPLLIHDDLAFLARGARRWLYGDLRSEALATEAEWRGMISDRTGRAAWLFTFGPGSLAHLPSEGYRMLYSVGVMDSWSPGGGNGRPEGARPIEGTSAANSIGIPLASATSFWSCWSGTDQRSRE